MDILVFPFFPGGGGVGVFVNKCVIHEPLSPGKFCYMIDYVDLIIFINLVDFTCLRQTAVVVAGYRFVGISYPRAGI